MVSLKTAFQLPEYLVSLAVFLMLLGCSEPPAGFVPVRGVIKTSAGSPLTNVEAIVRFDPYDPLFVDDGTAPPDLKTPQGTSCKGWLESDGSFTLTTQSHGVVAEFGHYKVHLVLFNPEKDNAQIPEKYQEYDASPWKAEITVNGKNEFEFVVEK